LNALIRDYAAADAETVVTLSLRARAPVFTSMEQIAGTEIVVRLHGEDWREHQARSVREVLADAVAALGGLRVGMIGTGGDPGHAPARRVYEKADYTLIPMARYFKAL